MKIPDFKSLTHPRLTEKVHAALVHIINPGDNVIDATVGNGRDTIFLAQCVGDNGKAIGFDIQETAITTTQNKFQELQLQDRIQLHHTSHETLAEVIPANWKNATRAIVFNLGYLPGINTDQHITTTTSSTLKALTASLEFISIGGAISIIAYPGHTEGKQELEAVLQWLEPLKSNSQYTIHHEIPHKPHMRTPSPQWIWIQRI